ncbi:hypothetical protein NFHSH190041_16480 [Shewanella sp. NFH-SH190041]|nr:hypothetical protein NFHSH190041_16480 [Shewanella sp. NFH-SH190041]
MKIKKCTISIWQAVLSIKNGQGDDACPFESRYVTYSLFLYGVFKAGLFKRYLFNIGSF